MVKVINANKSCSLQKEIIKAKASTCLRQSTMSDMDVFTKSAVCQKISTEWHSHLLGYTTILREVGRPPPSQLLSHATFILLKSMNILWINFDMPSFAWNSTLLTLLRAYRSMSLVCFEIFVWSFFLLLICGIAAIDTWQLLEIQNSLDSLCAVADDIKNSKLRSPEGLVLFFLDEDQCF